ncbi:MAG: helix-turn-helix transcriptional regulator [Bacteroidales bacterium]|nr:helix-turn-helix transcriptional regulator [Bacteroidales bacterium]MBQ4299308.1 helix-turn-helix transcriptional regulator [Bacteroidales bacterium]
MPIVVNIDVMLARRKMSSGELAEKVGITPANLSILKCGKAKAVRISTMNAICEALDCQPGDILEYRKEEISNNTEQ